MRKKEEQKIVWLIFCMFLLSTVCSYAQTLTIKGRVQDTTGEPMIGVTILVQSTAIGSVSDADGQYSIKVPSAGSALEFSYLGYTKQIIPANGRNTINVVMKEDFQKLDDVVVVAYGVQKKASVTGAVATIGSEELNKTKTANLSNAIVGKLPGVRAVQRSGTPGEGSSYDIRGFGSALVIVDGVPRDMTRLNPNDIESVTVLKDASAAVYGFKGSNGVFLVTTKKGSEGKPKINYSGYLGIQDVTRYPDFYNSYEYAMLQNEAYLNIGQPAPFSQPALDKYKNGGDPNYPDVDWWNETYKPNAPQYYQNLSVSGGGEKVKYYVSLAYTRQEGIWVSRDFVYEKYNLVSNINAKITKGLTADIQIGANLANRDRQYTSMDITRLTQLSKPTQPIYANNTAPYWYYGDLVGNPIRSTYKDEMGYDDLEQTQFTSSISLNWEIPWVKGLAAKAMIAYDRSSDFNKVWSKKLYEYKYNETEGVYDKYVRNPQTKLTEQYSRGYSPTQQYSVSYQNTFGKHDVSALALFELRNGPSDWFNAAREFTLSSIDQINAGDKLNMTNAGSANDWANAGLVGRVNYAFDNRYLVEGSFRYDGSSVFRTGHRWGFFPNISLGWRLSEEKFIKENVSWLSNLKLRASFGETGNDSFDPNMFRAGYNYPSGLYQLGEGGFVNGAVDKGIPNEVLTWYTIKTRNFGFEGNIMNGLFTLDVDIFNRTRDGLPATRNLSVPLTSGLTMPQENLNSDKVQGFEIVVGHAHTIGNVRYNVKANFSSTRESNGYLERAESSNRYNDWRENYTDRYKSITWGYKAIGQFQSYEEILNAPIQDGAGNKSLMPGDIKYQDFNGDGIIDGKDTKPIGHGGTPSMYYGLNVDLNYKDFDFNVLFQGAAGHEIAMGNDFMQPFLQQGLGNGADFWLDRWHREDPTDLESKWIPGEMPALRPQGYTGNSSVSTWSLMSQNYLRLKSIEIGYSIPKNILQKISVEKFRIYVSSFNTFTITQGGLAKYFDPENGNNLLQYYPQVRTFNFGLDLTF